MNVILDNEVNKQGYGGRDIVPRLDSSLLRRLNIGIMISLEIEREKRIGANISESS